MTILLRLFLLAALLLAPSGAFAAAERVALVIGNGAYQNAVGLPNPPNDASDIAGLLKRLDFEVIEGEDLTRNGMEDAIRKFAIASAKARIVLFFYAGHGMQVAGRNYLIPTDAKLLDRTALDFEAIDVNHVFQYMTGDGKVALAFLDACRNNPLARNFVRAMGPSRSASVGQGLAPTATAGSGLFIAFATAPNDVAQDGNGRNSPFTAALLRRLPTPGLEIQQVMTRVKADVQRATDGEQRPWHNSDLSAEVYLAPAVPKPAVADSDATAPDSVFWKALENTKDAGALQLFLKKFPDSPFVAEAERKLASLSEAVVRPDLTVDRDDEATRRCELLAQALHGKIVDVGNRRIQPREIVDACEAAVNENPKSGENFYNLALAYNNVDNYAEYERALTSASDLGHVKAMVALAWGLSSSWSDLSFEPEKAENLFLVAAESGSYSAAQGLENLYKYGRGSLKNDEKRRYWYDRRVDLIKAKAESGDAESLYSLGNAYMYGDGARIPVDPQRARELLEEAEQKEYLWAPGSLMSWYTNNDKGFVRDTAKALEYRREYEDRLLKLYERGNNSSITTVASLYNFYPTIKDIPRALTLYKEAASHGIVSAYSSLHSIYAYDDGYKNPGEALKWQLKYAAAKGKCGMSPEDLTQTLHPEIPMLATPENAARCVLDAVRRGQAFILYIPGIHNDWMTIYRPTRFVIQRILKEEGYYHGAVDGVFGRNTFNALKAYDGSAS